MLQSAGLSLLRDIDSEIATVIVQEAFWKSRSKLQTRIVYDCLTRLAARKGVEDPSDGPVHQGLQKNGAQDDS